MKDLNTELAELKLKNKALKDQMDIEVSMKNNLYTFILIHGLMKELQEHEKLYPLEIADSGRAPFLKYSDKVETEEKQSEKSIS